MKFQPKDTPVVSFEVPKSRPLAALSRKKAWTFFLTSPDPISDARICSSPAAGRIAKGEPASKTELADIVALAVIDQRLLFVPGLRWCFSKYLAAKLDFEMLSSLGKIAVLFSSYPDLLKPILSETELFVITRRFYNR